MKNTLGLLPLLALLSTSCGAFKPTVRTIDDIGTEACALLFAQKRGISIEDAARTICKSKEVLQPFLDALLAAQQPAGANAEKLGLIKPE